MPNPQAKKDGLPINSPCICDHNNHPFPDTEPNNHFNSMVAFIQYFFTFSGDKMHHFPLSQAEKESEKEQTQSFVYVIERNKPLEYFS